MLQTNCPPSVVSQNLWDWRPDENASTSSFDHRYHVEGDLAGAALWIRGAIQEVVDEGGVKGKTSATGLHTFTETDEYFDGEVLQSTCWQILLWQSNKEYSYLLTIIVPMSNT